MTPTLQGQTVVLIGGSAGIGLETARLARAEGAEVILTARNPERLEAAAQEVGARSSAAFDATDFDRLSAFFDDLPAPVDHVLLTGPGPYYAPLPASLLGDQIEQRREQLRAKLPIGRVVGPADIAELAVHLMTNTAVTGATFDIDGGQQLVAS